MAILQLQYNLWVNTIKILPFPIAGALPHKHKVVIAGNHELTFDPATNKDPKQAATFGKKKNETQTFDVKDPRELLTNCIYLEDSGISLYGIKIYGSPW
jgi:hypothetical protein